MMKIRPSLSEKNLKVGDTVYDFDGYENRRGLHFGSVVSVEENRVVIDVDGVLSEFIPSETESIQDKLRGWNRSISTLTAQPGDRGYQLQQHTGMTFSFTVKSVTPEQRILVQYDDPFRSPDAVKEGGCSVDQKLMYHYPGEPDIGELTAFTKNDVEGVLEKARLIALGIQGEGVAFETGDNTWDEQHKENFARAITVIAAHAEESGTRGAFCGDAIVEVALEVEDGKVSLGNDVRISPYHSEKTYNYEEISKRLSEALRNL